MFTAVWLIMLNELTAEARPTAVGRERGVRGVAAAVCGLGPSEPCYYDAACDDSSLLGCNAGGVGARCRFWASDGRGDEPELSRASTNAICTINNTMVP